MGNIINLNTASAAELIKLKGIGPGLASRIIDYRNNIGRFRTVAELAAVAGITEKMLREFEDEVIVGSVDDEDELPSIEVEIQLQNAAGDPYTGHRVKAQFTRRETLPAGNNNAPEVVLCEVEIVAEVTADGMTQLTFPNQINLEGNIRFRFLSPDGEVLKISMVAVENLGQQLSLEVNPKTYFDIDRNQDPGFRKPGKIRGRVIDAGGRVRIKDKQVVIWGATVNNPGEADYQALIVARTDNTGYFSSPYPVGIFTVAFSTIALMCLSILKKTVPFQIWYFLSLKMCRWTKVQWMIAIARMEPRYPAFPIVLT